MAKRKTTPIKGEFTWWLSKKGFILNDEYRIDLLWIDRDNNSAKIKITNLKTNESIETFSDTEVADDQ